jgi:hypothetical protein
VARSTSEEALATAGSATAVVDAPTRPVTEVSVQQGGDAAAVTTCPEREQIANEAALDAEGHSPRAQRHHHAQDGDHVGGKVGQHRIANGERTGGCQRNQPERREGDSNDAQCVVGGVAAKPAQDRHEVGESEEQGHVCEIGASCRVRVRTVAGKDVVDDHGGSGPQDGRLDPAEHENAADQAPRCRGSTGCVVGRCLANTKAAHYREQARPEHRGGQLAASAGTQGTGQQNTRDDIEGLDAGRGRKTQGQGATVARAQGHPEQRAELGHSEVGTARAAGARAAIVSTRASRPARACSGESVVRA